MQTNENQQHCEGGTCQGDDIDTMMETLGACYTTIDDWAADIKTTPEEVERYLRQTQRIHNIDLVSAGLEKVGSAPVFVSRPRGPDAFEVTLYSMLPDEEWNLRA